MHERDDSPTRFLPDEAATREFGACLGVALGTAGLVVYLEGDLGAGKTTLVRGLLQGLGHRGAVRSPTYTLIEPYVLSNLNLYHFDFYRFAHPDEFLDAGLEEYFGEQSICLVEWPGKADPHLPPPDLRVELAVSGTGRSARVTAHSKKGESCLSAIRH
ncbi:tRNA (adenosine(37)-N6)-threonylcarbamoyltransferase complex ATPase subunit type 1 TsaE [Niveibacterium sp. SC-1]|uniref:tRNA (adenosine(37)-N6)-threonylcarbamoyltransferase complex ATPase subunit type 1 TsaE n=1 Tax=Niveibacterium sp. SC-1 TaxID=3135646 RepID=UPI00311F67A5